MSILDEIEKLCKRQTLHLLEPLGLRAHLVPLSERRKLYMTADLARYFERRESNRIQTDLNVYMLGDFIRAALTLDHKDARMARLDPARDDVWEIRIREREPQFRLFGRFAVTDVFVVLRGPARRNEVKSKGFDRLKDECLAEWQQTFGLGNPPDILGSTNIHDYISKNVDLA